MAYRVSYDEVREIIETTLDDQTIGAYVGAANLVITEHLGGASLGEEKLKEIERWLTAHLMACTREHQPQAEVADKASITYQGKTGMGLDATFYGQQVKLLDSTGILAGELGKKPVMIYSVTSFE